MRHLRYVWMIVMCLLLSAVTVAGQPFLRAEAEEAERPNVVDEVGLLTDTEKGALSAEIKEISQKQSCDIVIVAVPNEQLNGQNIRDYADDYFDYNGYGIGDDASGILLMLSMDEDGHGNYWISTCGYGITAFTDAGISYIGNAIVPYLKDKDYAGAFDVFAEQCDEFLTKARKGTPYDVDEMPKEPFKWDVVLYMALVAGFVTGFIVVTTMKAKLKTVRPAKAAANYIRAGSMRLTRKSDIYLYRNVTRRARPKETSSSGGGGGGSSVHRSSSGRSHGGGGGSF